MPRRSLVLISLLLSLALSAYTSAEVYKTVDKNGRVTYTDVPPANTEAKPIELKSINSIPAATVTPPTDAQPSNNTQGAQNYQVQILAPENGITLMPDQRSITISISLSSSLENDDMLIYKIDDSTLAKTSEMSYIIAEPPRGEHSLTVEVVNSEGKSLAQSNAITVFVMRPLVKQTATPVPKK